MATTKQFVYDRMANFILARYPRAVIDDHATWYMGRVELDFLPHPNALESFACVVTPGHNPRILTEF